MDRQVVRFSGFEVDMHARELRKAGSRVRLQDQPFHLLAILLEHPGDIVTREQMRERLWPEGTFVDFEHSVNAAIKRLRAALGDTAENPRFVETLHRRGYRFVAPIDQAAALAGPAPAPGNAPASSDRRPRSRDPAVHEPERRSRAGLFQRRTDRGDDRAGRPPLREPHRRARAHLVDALQERRARRPATSARRCTPTIWSRAACAAKATACGSPRS